MKKNGRFFLVLIAFYIVVAIGALMMLNGNTSVFNRTAATPGAETAVLNETIIGDDEKQEEETVVPVEPVQEEEEVEEIEEPVEPEPLGTEEDTLVEETAEPEIVDETEPAKRYFSYTVNTSTMVLRLREEPNDKAKIIKKLGRNSGGYVLQPGNTWSKVVIQDGTVGYCATEYLKVKEMTESEYPEQYRDQVVAPEEALTATTWANAENSMSAADASTEALSDEGDISKGTQTETDTTAGSEADVNAGTDTLYSTEPETSDSEAAESTDQTTPLEVTP